MKVSIITSCYNREGTIRSCIESVLSQDYKNIEYIIIDGASKDSSLSIINEYSKSISTIISEPDKGMYEAINKGIKLATGDIIGLLHSDDVFYSSNIISTIVNRFESFHPDIIYGDGLFVDKNDIGKIIRNWISRPYSKSRIKKGWLPLHPTTYIKTECISKAGLYNEKYKISADSDLLLRYLFKENFKVYYLHEYIVKMRMGGLSTDFSKMKQKWTEDLNIYKENNFNPYFSLFCKIISKVPQFITAKFTKIK